jgi:gliding motility-associated-like protein
MEKPNNSHMNHFNMFKSTFHKNSGISLLPVFFFLILQTFTLTNGHAQCSGPVISTFPYNEGFEAGPAWTTGAYTSTNRVGKLNDWAWGAPAHATINTAGGGTKCWCVGGLNGNFYNYGEQCYIQSPCFDFTNLNFPWISLKIFWEDEYKYDGLQLTASTDGGLSWNTVGRASDPVDCMNANWYNYKGVTNLDSGTTVKDGWCGRVGATQGSCQGGNGSKQWVTATHCLVGLANQPSVIFRLQFGAGTTCNGYDGIAIDDILIQNALPNVANFSFACAGVNKIIFTNLSTPCANGYSWNFGDPGSGAANTSTGTNPSHTYPSGGTYTVTLNATGPCSPMGTISIPVSITAATISSTKITCVGANNGTATATVNTGTGPFTYSWSPGGMSTQTVTGLSAGTYTVHISGAGICPVTNTVTFTQPAGLSASAASTASTCGGSNGTATVTPAGGSGAYTYSWSPSGGTGAGASGLAAGSYTCTVTDANACTTTATATVTQPSTLSVAPATANLKCNGGTNGSASVFVTGGSAAYTYSWSPVAATTDTIKNLSAGTYTCLVTDASGCSFTVTATVTQPAVIQAKPMQVNVSCNAASNGSASALVSGGTAAYSYSWTPGNATSDTIKGIPAGIYTCVITDANGCTSTLKDTLTEPSAIAGAIAQTNVLCHGASTGSAVITASGGISVYAYSWNAGLGVTDSAKNLAAGTYTCTITDSHNCILPVAVNISEPSALAGAATATSTLCAGTSGTAAANPSGGTGVYTFSWSPSGGTASTASSLSPGTYTCFITDANGCKASTSATVNTPSTLSVIPALLNVKCNGGNTGAVSVAVTGGTAAYTYSWTPGAASTDTITGLTAGVYTCTVKDANGCIFVSSTTVTEPAMLSGVAIATNVTCNGSNDGSINAIVSGGTTGYTYSWSPGSASTAIISGLAPGSDTCFITDANGCKTKAITSITQPAILVSSVSQTAATCTLLNGSMSTITSGGTSPYTYSWTPAGGSGANASGLSAGQYTCFITDVSGCNLKDTLTLQNIGKPPVAVVASSGPIPFCQNTNVTLTASGGSSFVWSPGGATSASITASNAGTYQVVVTNSCGKDSVNKVITLLPLPLAVITGATMTCKGDSIKLTASGASTYTWSNGATTFTTNPYYVSATGTYTLFAQNSCGSATSTQTIAIDNVNAKFTADTTKGVPGVLIIFTNASSPNAISWSWDFGDGATATGPNQTHPYGAPGNYTAKLTVTDAFNCTSTYSMVITVIEEASAIHVPNVFSPNGDNVNDAFYITSQGLSSFDMKIYDRWGVLMGHVNSAIQGWDGRTKGGVLATDGTYYYIIEAAGYDGKKYNLTGFLLLVR